MPSEHAELTGVLQKFRFRSTNGWCVAVLETRAKEEVVIKGELPGCEVGDRIEVKGQWADHPRYGRSLKVSAATPARVTGVEAFLMLLPEIGPRRAKVIKEQFGDSVWDVIRHDPAKLAAVVSGLTEDRMAAVLRAYENLHDQRDTLIWFYDHGMTAYQIELATRHREKDDPRARESLKRVREWLEEDPYVLAAVDGIGFRTADRFALRLGINPQGLRRAHAAIGYVLEAIEEEGGNTYCHGNLLLAHTRGYEKYQGRTLQASLNPSIPDEVVYEAIGHLQQRDEVHMEGSSLQSQRAHQAEITIALAIAEKLR